MLRKAYSKYNIYNNEIRLERKLNLINIIPIEEEISNHDLFLELALNFLKEKLCDDAFLLLEIELNPPPYIMSKVKNLQTKIPTKLIAEYLELEPIKNSIQFINDLRREIQFQIERAREYFMQNKFAIQLQ